MFLFAHIGFTLGAAVAVKGLTDNGWGAVWPWPWRKPARSVATPDATDVPARSSISPADWPESLGKFFDLRLLALGSMLPDIIDKPLGMLLYGNGRIFTHSLLVTLLVVLIGVYLYINYKKTALLAVGLGMAGHLILDFMWQNPRVFLWPLYGWGFPSGTRTSYLSVWLNTLTHDPSAYLTEGIGLLILVVLVAVLTSKKEFIKVMIKGRL